MADENQRLYEISCVLDSNAWQYRFMATEGAPERVRDQIADVLLDVVGDFQIYAPTSGGENAAHLVETLMEALSHCEGSELESAFAAAKGLSAEVDAEAEAAGAAAVARDMEFVWDNGGGDDNCFTQGYMAGPGSLKSAAFEAALEAAMEDHAYDIGFSNADSLDEVVRQSGLQNALAELAAAIVDIPGSSAAIGLLEELAAGNGPSAAPGPG